MPAFRTLHGCIPRIALCPRIEAILGLVNLGGTLRVPLQRAPGNPAALPPFSSYAPHRAATKGAYPLGIPDERLPGSSRLSDNSG